MNQNLPPGWAHHPNAPGWAYNLTNTSQVVPVDQLAGPPPPQPPQPVPPGAYAPQPQAAQYQQQLPQQYQQLPAAPQPGMPQQAQPLPEFGTHDVEYAKAAWNAANPVSGNRSESHVWVNMPELTGGEVSLLVRLLPTWPADRRATQLISARHRIPAKMLLDPPEGRDVVYFDCPHLTQELAERGSCPICKVLDMDRQQFRDNQARRYSLLQVLNLSDPSVHMIQVIDPQTGQSVQKVIPGVLRAGAKLGDGMSEQFTRGRQPSSPQQGFPLELIKKRGNKPKLGQMNVDYSVDHHSHQAGPIPPELQSVLYNLIDLRTLVRFPSQEEGQHIADQFLSELKQGQTWQVPGQGTFQSHPNLPGHALGPDGAVYPQTFMPQNPGMPPGQPNMPPAAPPAAPQPAPGPAYGHPQQGAHQAAPGAPPAPPLPPSNVADQLAQSGFAAPRGQVPPQGPPPPPPGAPAVSAHGSYPAPNLPPASAPGLPPGGMPAAPPPPMPGQQPPHGAAQQPPPSPGNPPPPPPGAPADQQLEAQYGTSTQTPNASSPQAPPARPPEMPSAGSNGGDVPF